MAEKFFNISTKIFKVTKRLTSVVFSITKKTLAQGFKTVPSSMLVTIVITGLFCQAIYVFANPSDLVPSPYYPGETLNPTCSPGDSNCSVTPPAIYSFSTNNFSGTGNFTTTGIVTAGTLKIGSIMTFPTTDGSPNQYLKTNGSGALSWGTVDTSGLVPYTGASGNVTLGAYTLTTPTVIGGTGTTSDLNLQTTSGVGTTGADMHFLVGNNGATEAMTILNSGNVGIGTTSPTQKFDVNNFFVVDSANSRVGIGTTAPLTKLQISGNSGLIVDTDRSAYSELPSGVWLSSKATSISITSQYNPIDTDGKIVLGYRRIADNAILSALEVQNIATAGTYSNLLLMKSGGNVGIGTTSPGAQLNIRDLTANPTGDHFQLTNTYNDNYAALTTRSGSYIDGNSRAIGWVLGNGNNSGATLTNGFIAGTSNGTISSAWYMWNGAATFYTGNFANAALTLGSSNMYFSPGHDGTYTIKGDDGSNRTVNLEMYGSNAAVPGYLKLGGGDGQGTNIAGANLTLYGGKATGNAVGGPIYFQTSDAGSSGTALQSLTTKMTILASGNVGIGTTSPSSQLDLVGDNNIFRMSASSDSNYRMTIENMYSAVNPLYFKWRGGTFLSVNNQSGSTYDLKLMAPTAGGDIYLSSNAIVKSAGNVGIGTTSPGAKLDIQAPRDSGQKTLFNLGLNNNSIYTGDEVSMDFKWWSNLFYMGRISGYVEDGNHNYAGLKFYTGNSNDGGGLSSSPSMTLDGHGNVGIGTTSPLSKLAVVSTGDGIYSTVPSGYYALLVTNSTNNKQWGIEPINNDLHFREFGVGEKLTLQAGGNVGIGITNPAASLHVFGSSWPEIRVSSTTTSTGTAFSALNNNNYGVAIQSLGSGRSQTSYFGQTDANGAVVMTYNGGESYMGIGTYTGSAPLIFGTNNIERMRILSTGNVGIGTTAPYSKLDVIGSNSIHIAGTAVDSGGYFDTAGSNAFYLSGGAKYSSYTSDYVFTAKETAASGQIMENGNAYFYGNSGLTTGNTFTPTRIMTIIGASSVANTLYLSSGNVGIGTSGAAARKLEVNGSIRMGALITGAGGAVAVYRDTNGDLADSTSSARYKTDIINMENILPQIMQLNAVRFKWNDQTSTPGMADFGMISEEVNKILQDLVTFEADGTTPRGLKYEKMGLFALKGIQEQQSQLDAISAKLNGLVISTDGTTGDGAVAGVDLSSPFVTSIKNILAALGINFGSDKSVKVQKLCVGETCIDENQLKDLLNKNGVQGSAPAPLISDTPPAEDTVTPPADAPVIPEPSPAQAPQNEGGEAGIQLVTPENTLDSPVQGNDKSLEPPPAETPAPEPSVSEPPTQPSPEPEPAPNPEPAPAQAE